MIIVHRFKNLSLEKSQFSELNKFTRFHFLMFLNGKGGGRESDQ